jgi:hypothetical protein
MLLPMKLGSYLCSPSLIGNFLRWALGTIMRGIREMRAVLPDLVPSAPDDQSVITEQDNNRLGLPPVPSRTILQDKSVRTLAR